MHVHQNRLLYISRYIIRKKEKTTSGRCIQFDKKKILMLFYVKRITEINYSQLSLNPIFCSRYGDSREAGLKHSVGQAERNNNNTITGKRMKFWNKNKNKKKTELATYIFLVAVISFPPFEFGDSSLLRSFRTVGQNTQPKTKKRNKKKKQNRVSGASTRQTATILVVAVVMRILREREEEKNGAKDERKD